MATECMLKLLGKKIITILCSFFFLSEPIDHMVFIFSCPRKLMIVRNLNIYDHFRNWSNKFQNLLHTTQDNSRMSIQKALTEKLKSH